MKQPAVGVLGTVITVVVALFICSRFAPPTLLGWVALIIMNAIPFQIIMGLVWKFNYPGFLGKLPQPFKGLMALVLMTVATAIFTNLVLALVSGHAPTPFAIMFTISAVCSTFWMVAVFHCWPMTAISKHPAVIGLGTLVISYVVNAVVFRLAFNFGGMKGAPWYSASFDPQGALPAFTALAFIVLTVTFAMSFVMFDFWPTASIAKAIPAVGKQPLFGIVTGLLLIVLSLLVQGLCVNLLHMEIVDFMVRIAVSGLFGNFIMLVAMQTAPFQTTKQPAKGAILAVFVIVLAALMHWIYQGAAGWIAGPLPSGPPTYVQDLWIATAMLSVTFPGLVAFADGFGFWPLSRTQPAAKAAAEQAAAGAGS